MPSRAPRLGIYGFRNRRDHSYERLSIADSRAVRAPRVWDLLSERGRSVIVLGVPPTCPVTPVNGVMISCFLTPDTERSQFTYPAELKQELEQERYLTLKEEPEEPTRLHPDLVD
jgi:predicted AlkP superfamily phosphohydrolase/phosphomutase